MPASTSALDDGARGAGRAVVIDPDDLPPVEGQSLGSLIGQSVEDARALVTAEIALYKARIAERLTAYKGAIIFFSVVGMLTLCGFIALLVGLILSLATLIGPGLATLAVVGSVFVAAGVLAVVGKRRLAPPKLDAVP